MKRFLFRTLAVALPVLVLIVTVNYCIDPANIFSEDGLEQRAALMLLDGKNVAGLSNYDERRLQKEFVSRLSEAPGTVVLGSSRGMLIDCKNGDDSSLVNSCVSGAGLEDIMAVYGLYAEHNRVPRRLIIELSPYMFNRSTQDTRYRTLDQEFDRVAVAAGLKQSQGPGLKVDAKYVELVSLSYFQSAVRMLWQNTEVTAIAAVTDSMDKTRLIKFPDGSIMYSGDYQKKGVTALEIQAAADFGNSERFVTVSERRRKIFETFIGYLLEQGLVVEFYLSPLPEQVCSKKPVFKTVEAYVVSYASDHNIRVRGSFDSRKYGLSLADFYDGMHPRKQVYDSIMR